MRNGTVKEFLDALEEMHSIYPFKDEDTQICTHDIRVSGDELLTIATTDEKTGIVIQMSKHVKYEV